MFAKDVETLPGQLTAAGKTWRAYVEDSDAAQPPDTCRHPAPGGALEPVMARNPYLFFHAIVDSPDCAANTAGTSRLLPDSRGRRERADAVARASPTPATTAPTSRAPTGAPGGPGRRRRVAEGAARPAARLQGVQGRRPGRCSPSTPRRTRPSRSARCSSPTAVEAGATDDGDYRPANLLRTLEDGFTLDPLARAKDVHAVSITKPSR